MHKQSSFARIASVVVVLLTPASSLVGCKDDDVTRSQYSITEDEAAIIAVNGFGSSSSTCGLTGQVEELASIANGGTLQKGTGEQTTALDTVTVTRSKTALHSYNWIFHLSYGIIGNQFNAEYGMRGTYDTPGMSSEDTAHASLRFLTLPAETLLVDGYYWRVGLQVSRVGERRSFNSEILATFSDIRVDRTATLILGGTVTFTLRERFPDGSIVSLPGTCTYLDSHHALLTINRKTYTVNLDTATVTGT